MILTFQYLTFEKTLIGRHHHHHHHHDDWQWTQFNPSPAPCTNSAIPPASASVHCCFSFVAERSALRDFWRWKYSQSILACLMLNASLWGAFGGGSISIRSWHVCCSRYLFVTSLIMVRGPHAFHGLPVEGQ
jgi:hypothetical protein